MNASHLKETASEMPANVNPDIRIFYKITENLNFSNDEPLWYINQPLIKALIGPISTTNLENMHKENLINSSTEIRMLDFFSLNKNSNFGFLKVFEFNEKVLDYLLPSNLMKRVLKENKTYKVKIHLNKNSDFEDFDIIRKNIIISNNQIENTNSYLNSTFNNNLNKSPISIKSENTQNQIGSNLFNRSNMTNVSSIQNTNKNLKGFYIHGFDRGTNLNTPKKEEIFNAPITPKKNIEIPKSIIIKGINKSPEKPQILKPNIPIPDNPKGILILFD